MEEGNDWLVVDCGSDTIKAGRAGDDEPHCVFDCVVNVRKDKRKDKGKDGSCLELRTYIEILSAGQKMYSLRNRHVSRYMRHLTKDVRPIKNRCIRNWEYMERLWRHTFVDELRVDPTEHPVLITEPHDEHHPSAARERTAKVMFETIGVPVLTAYLPSVLALFASGRTTGTVLDSGFESTAVVTIADGYMIPPTVQLSTLGGHHLSSHLCKLWSSQRSICLVERSELVSVEDMKRKFCRVCLDFDRELHRHVRMFHHRRVELLRCLGKHRTASGLPLLENLSHLRRRIFSFSEKNTRPEEPDGHTYRLPDGRDLKLKSLEFECPEPLFTPLRMGLDNDSLHEMVFRAITATPHTDVIPSLYRNIVLCGGNTLFPGLPDRLKAEVSSMAPPGTEVKVVKMPAKDGHYAAWIGGSILTSLEHFPLSNCITKQEFQDVGPGVVHRKRQYV